MKFGDGDEIHQIYSHMRGISITWHTCVEQNSCKFFREDPADLVIVDIATNDVNARPVAKSTRGLGGTPNACLIPSHLGTTQAGN